MNEATKPRRHYGSQSLSLVLSVVALCLGGVSGIAQDTLDGARLRVVNAPLARIKLGLSNQFIINLGTNSVVVAAGSGVSVTTNATGTNVIYTITVSAGGTNTLWMTNGTVLGSAGTANFTTGVTGFLAGAVAHLGVSASGSGAVGNFNTDQFAASATHTNIKSGALQTNGIFKADAGASRALMVDTNILVVTNGQVGVRVPPDANGHLTVEGATTTGIIVKHSTGSPRMLLSPVEVGTKTDTEVELIVNNATRWNIGDSSLGYPLYPEGSNTIDFARQLSPVKVGYFQVVSMAKATNLLALNYDRAQMFVPTNNALSNITVNFSTTNYVEIYATNNLTFTNWVGITDGGVGNYTALIRPQLVIRGVNWGNLGLSNPGFGVAIGTNVNNTMWTSLTNGQTYALTITRFGTNLFPTLTQWL